MAEVFAGFVAGYALALLSTPVLAVTLLRLRATSPLLERLLPAGTSAVSFSFILHGALFMLCTGLGVLLGLLLFAMRDEAGGAGSLNVPFTLFVAGFATAVFSPIAIVARPIRSATIVAALLVVIVFGWLMPYLAEWSAFEDKPADTTPKPAAPIPWFV